VVRSFSRATLVLVPDTANPYRKDIAGFVRRAEYHCGAQLLYDKAGWTVEDTARALESSSNGHVSAAFRSPRDRRAVRRRQTQADSDADALRALLRCRSERGAAEPR